MDYGGHLFCQRAAAAGIPAQRGPHLPGDLSVPDPARHLQSGRRRDRRSAVVQLADLGQARRAARNRRVRRRVRGEENAGDQSRLKIPLDNPLPVCYADIQYLLPPGRQCRQCIR